MLHLVNFVIKNEQAIGAPQNVSPNLHAKLNKSSREHPQSQAGLDS